MANICETLTLNYTPVNLKCRMRALLLMKNSAISAIFMGTNTFHTKKNSSIKNR